MKKIFLLIIVAFGFGQKTQAQVVISDNDNTTSVNLETNAVLKVISNKSGVLLPRLEKIRIDEKQNNYTGELFFSKAHNCLMINIADKSEQNPEWKCIAVMPEAIPKN